MQEVKMFLLVFAYIFLSRRLLGNILGPVSSSILSAIIAMIMIALAPPVAAHVPGIAVGQVIEVPDAAKSYAWYGILEDSDAAESYLLSLFRGCIQSSYYSHSLA